MVEEKVVESSGKTKTDNGYGDEQSRYPDQHLHAKSSSVMHEESSEESYLQVRKDSLLYFIRSKLFYDSAITMIFEFFNENQSLNIN